MIRIALIGAGGMAENHAKKFAAAPGCKVVACADHRADQAARFASRFGIGRSFGSIDALLGAGGFDAVACSIVDGKHAEACVAALRLGLPVFCEKPLARSIADAAAMAAEAAAARVPAAVNFSKRNAPALAALRSAVVGGLLGEVKGIRASYLQNWVATKGWGDWTSSPRWRWRLSPAQSTAGSVGDLGSHLVDALAYVFGPEAAGSEAAGPGPEALLAVRRPGRGMDLAAAMEAGLVSRENLAPDLLALSAAERPAWVEFEAELELSGGAPVAISTSWIARGHVNDFRIVVEGSDASAELDFNRSHTGIELRKRSGEASVLEGEGEPSTYDRFLDAVKNGSRPRPDFDDALGVQRILDALLPGGLPL